MNAYLWLDLAQKDTLYRPIFLLYFEYVYFHNFEICSVPWNVNLFYKGCFEHTPTHCLYKNTIKGESGVLETQDAAEYIKSRMFMICGQHCDTIALISRKYIEYQ